MRAVKPHPGSGPEGSFPEDPSPGTSPVSGQLEPKGHEEASEQPLAISLNHLTEEGLNPSQQQLKAGARKGFGKALEGFSAQPLCTGALGRTTPAPPHLTSPAWRGWVPGRERLSICWKRFPAPPPHITWLWQPVGPVPCPGHRAQPECGTSRSHPRLWHLARTGAASPAQRRGREAGT